MNTARLLDDLTDQGLILAVEGDLLTVSPRERITGQQRALIRDHKPELIALLSKGNPPRLTPADREAIQEAIEERAGILEFDAGLPRHVAETQAAEAMRVYRYRLTDRPDWLILIAPGCDLAEARRTLVATFGAARLLDLAPHPAPPETAPC